MACHTAIPENRWYDLFPKSFVITHIYEKASVELFERYRAQLPTVQDAAEAAVECRQLRKIEEEQEAKITRLRRLLGKAQGERQETQTKLAHRQGIISGTVTRFEKVRRVVRCLTPTCNAFLDEKMHCGVCSTAYCGSCHEVKHEGDCDPAKAADMLYLKRNTRSCPQCGTNIQKVEGCDQMFCVVPECNTFFSYQTGKEIRSGPLHNPHYIERLRAGGVVNFRQTEGERPPGQCDFPSVRALQRAFPVAPRAKDPIYNSIINFHRSITHLVDGLMRVPQEPPYVRRSMIQFLLKTTDIMSEPGGNPYTKEMFINDIKKHCKISQHEKEVQTVMTLCRDIGQDLFRNYVLAPYAMLKFYQELVHMAAMTNASLFQIEKTYGWKPSEVFITDASNVYHLELRAHRFIKDFHPWNNPDSTELIVV
jgi:hypothetical protein